jgi:hypothetical protein
MSQANSSVDTNIQEAFNMKLRTYLFQLVGIVVLLSLATQCLGYGREGHKAVGLMAQNHLNENASKAIAKLLESDKCKDLACVAPWPDDLKQAARRHQGPLKDDPEAKDFQARFPNNDKWHSSISLWAAITM